MSISKQNAQGRVIDDPFPTRNHVTATQFTTEDALRFWAKADRGVGRDDCWRWTGAKLGRDGYGGFSVARGKPRGQQPPKYAHRVAYELTHGPIAPGLSVCHRCDNPICVNPTHLFLGTQADNIRDASAKGRLSVARKRNRSVKVEVVARYITHDVTAKELAREFGVSYMTVHRWVRAATGTDQRVRGGNRKRTTRAA